MAISLSGTGGLFTRWGVEFGAVRNAVAAVGATATTQIGLINDEYLAAQQSVIDSLYATLDTYRGSASAWLTAQQKLMEDTLVQMAIDDGIGINPEDFDTALAKLIAQMISASATINAPTLGQTITYVKPNGGANTGTGIGRLSFIDAIDGKQSDYVFQEAITATCSGDSYPGGSATAGQEPFTFTGETPAANNLDWNWPLGSNCAQSINAFNPAATGGILTDGDFEDWGDPVTNVPTNWPIIAGSALIARGTSPYTGTYNLKITGDGSTLAILRQTINVANLAPNTVYGCNVFAKSDGSVAAGVIRFALVDGSNTVINDNAGNPCSFSITCSALTSGYLPYPAAAPWGFFRTPTILPSTVKFEIALTTAVTNTEVLQFDHLGLVPATLLYSGGPRACVFSGATPFQAGDFIKFALTNSNALTSPIDTFAIALWQMFNLGERGFKIPSAVGAGTISDALIV